MPFHPTVYWFIFFVFFFKTAIHSLTYFLSLLLYPSILINLIFSGFPFWNRFSCPCLCFCCIKQAHFPFVSISLFQTAISSHVNWMTNSNSILAVVCWRREPEDRWQHWILRVTRPNTTLDACVSWGDANKMAAILSYCIKVEQRVVVRFFLWTEGVKGAEIYIRLCAQYGGNALPRQSAY